MTAAVIICVDFVTFLLFISEVFLLSEVLFQLTYFIESVAFLY